MFQLKSLIKIIINYIQDIFKLNILSKKEKTGRIEFFSRLKFFKGSSISVPFLVGRTIRGVAFNNPELDPLYRCLINQNFDSFDENVFANDFNKICHEEEKKTVGDFLRIISNQDISNLPSWTIAFPWENRGFFDLKKQYLKLLIKNRNDQSKGKAYQVSDLFSYQFSLSQANQYKFLIKKLSEEGFNLKYSRPKAYILIDGKNWRWIMSGNGNHRAYIMSALKYNALPITIAGIIDRSKSYKFPNVLNGELTQNEAEEIFDIVFKGEECIRGCR